MTIDYARLKDWPFSDVTQNYTERDTMLYALALGLGQNPLDELQLRFVYEKDLQALPTMVAVLGWPGLWTQDPALGIDWKKVLNGEVRIRFHKPLPRSGLVLGHTEVTGVIDKGSAKGAVLVTERTVRDGNSGELYATVEQSTFCRGDGGFSSHGGQHSDNPRPPLPPTPSGAPDQSLEVMTRPESALLYRLCGDCNALHVDPAVSRAAGFDRPILHGLATYGIAGHAVLSMCCGSDPARLKSLACRFSAPVIPGEALRFDIWHANSGAVHFRGIASERGTDVVTCGFAEVA